MPLNVGQSSRPASSADKLSVEWTSCLGQSVACGERRKGWIAFKSPVHEVQAGQASPGSSRSGPAVHAGLTGRKNAIDTYGESARQSGAALSGKEPLRIDRVGAYAARCAAKNVVAAGLAQEGKVQLSYSIGQAQPVRIQVETFGTGHVPNGIIRDLLAQHCEFRLAGIIKQFKLRTLPVQLEGGYQRLAAYGHVGRMDIQLPWEETDMVPILQEHSWCR